MKYPRTQQWATALGLVALTGALGACDIESPTGDPNAVPEADLNQLFIANQVATFYHQGSELSRLSSVWMQQLFGADRQFSSIQTYVFNEEDGEDIWRVTYRDGGLLELRQAQELAQALDRPAYLGILQVHEAYLIGMAASIWGDVPYSEAVDPNTQSPVLDPQLEVYAAVQSLLDQAIANMQSGEGAPAAAVDLNFGGDVQSWIKVAHSLKARFYMHVAEVQGQPAYEQALAHARQGISSAENNWVAVHTNTSTENNLWYQFQRDRSGYIAPNDFLVTLLNDQEDPRLPLYFAQIAVNEENLASAQDINVPATQGYDQPIVSCAETQFIEAEAALALGRLEEAREAYREGLACQEEWWNSVADVASDQAVFLPVELEDRSAGLTGDALLREIIQQKYIALFLNAEVWNDYKRTCFPAITPTGTVAGSEQVPPGLFYPGDERETNPNVPENSESVLRNSNDPNPC